jgi:tetratricopeptide (TPR) repeat protein
LLSTLSSAAVLSADRDMATALLSSAEKSLKSNDYQTAKSMCERAIQADETFAQAHFTMGQTLEAMTQSKEAIRSYQTCAELAKKDNNTQLVNKALDAAKKLGPGLVDLGTADQKLVDSMINLGDKTLAEGHLETAKKAYTAALALVPDHAKAKENLAKVSKMIEDRGDPVRARIASAAMSEVWYYVGNANRDKTKAKENMDKARTVAQDVSAKFGDLDAGKEAQRLLTANFDLSKTIGEELAAAKKELIEKQKIVSAKPAPATGPATAPRTDTAAPTRVNVDATEKAANDETKKLPKDKLAATFADAYTKGKGFYSNATPGTEGNQKNLASALEQFIKCESMYLRMEEEKLLTPEIEEDFKQASMLRYACMKMTILSQ